MEEAFIVNAQNQPLTTEPVMFARIPVAGDWVSLEGQLLQVIAVLFSITQDGNRVLVKAVPHSAPA